MSHAWMPFYVGDYLRDTMHLSALEHGMYLLLIAHYWQHGGLPTSVVALARIARTHENTFRDHRSTLAAFFSMPDWRHKRIDAELAKIENIRIKRRLAANRRWDKPTSRRSKSIKQLHEHNRDLFKFVTCKSIDNHKESKKEEHPPVDNVDNRSLASALPTGALANGHDTEPAWKRKRPSEMNHDDWNAYYAAKKEGRA